MYDINKLIFLLIGIIPGIQCHNNHHTSLTNLPQLKCGLPNFLKLPGPENPVIFHTKTIAEA